jgi:peptidoglycan/LPS O-acetylase OafA/YrhL
MPCGQKLYMTLSINNPIFSTYIFIGIFLSVLLLSYRRTNQTGLTIAKSQELKGFAICTVLFAHIGYFLSNQHEFLFPLSILAGVGVDLFLFLSGFGLTMSSLSKNEGIIQFYKRRALRLLVPFWIVLGVYLLLDFFVLHIVYSKQFIIESFFGIFPHASIFSDLNSPFWYMTLILFYYLLFPLVFFRKKPWITAFILYMISWVVFKIHPQQFSSVMGLYEVHAFAFPLGILYAWLLKKEKVHIFLKKISNIFTMKPVRYGLYSVLLLCISYFAINSGVGKGITIEQNISIVIMLLILTLGIIRRGEFALFSMLGLYSYEIYLIHWPLMYRYDILYSHLWAWFATVLYIPVLVALGFLLKKLSDYCIKILKI